MSYSSSSPFLSFSLSHSFIHFHPLTHTYTVLFLSLQFLSHIGIMHEGEKGGSPWDEKGLLALVSYRVCCLKDGKIRRGGCNYRKKIPYYEGIWRCSRLRLFPTKNEECDKTAFKKEWRITEANWVIYILWQLHQDRRFLRES